jgi:hypothetical protein
MEKQGERNEEEEEQVKGNLRKRNAGKKEVITIIFVDSSLLYPKKFFVISLFLHVLVRNACILIGYSACIIHCKNRVAIFPSPAGNRKISNLFYSVGMKC